MINTGAWKVAMADRGIVVTVLLPVKAEHVDAVSAQLAHMVEETAQRPGFRDVEIVSRADDPGQLMFFEHWDDVESYQRYIDWRTERGDMTAMADLLAGPLVIQIWPQRVVRRGAAAAP